MLIIPKRKTLKNSTKIIFKAFIIFLLIFVGGKKISLTLTLINTLLSL
jgi:hypothetical protein